MHIQLYLLQKITPQNQPEHFLRNISTSRSVINSAQKRQPAGIRSQQAGTY